jgi:hypothetical protein
MPASPGLALPFAVAAMWKSSSQEYMRGAARSADIFLLSALIDFQRIHLYGAEIRLPAL